jgi:hypothetical protein
MMFSSSIVLGKYGSGLFLAPREIYRGINVSPALIITCVSDVSPLHIAYNCTYLFDTLNPEKMNSFFQQIPIKAYKCNILKFTDLWKKNTNMS